MSASSAQVELSRPAVAGFAIAFLLMGVEAAAYGPLLILLMQRFSLGIASVGVIFGVHSAGTLLGVAASMIGMARLVSRRVVSMSVALFGLGFGGMVLAGSWPATLLAVLVLGIGYGLLDVAVNQLVAYSVNPRHVALLNGLNGIYGLGAVAAPLLVSLAGENYPTIYGFAAALLILAWYGSRRLTGDLSANARPSGTPEGNRVSLLALFGVGFALYVGVEIGIGGWMPTELHATGAPVSTAAAITSGYWLTFAIGRFLFAAVASRWLDARVVLAATLAAIVLLLAAAAIPALAAYAYVATGLALAPIFPMGVAWVARLHPGNPTATSWIFPAASIGGMVIPSAAGLLIAAVGVPWVPAIFAFVALCSLLGFSGARFTARDLKPA